MDIQNIGCTFHILDLLYWTITFNLEIASLQSPKIGLIKSWRTWLWLEKGSMASYHFKWLFPRTYKVSSNNFCHLTLLYENVMKIQVGRNRNSNATSERLWTHCDVTFGTLIESTSKHLDPSRQTLIGRLKQSYILACCIKKCPLMDTTDKKVT